jgi:hypothetical protein
MLFPIAVAVAVGYILGSVTTIFIINISNLSANKKNKSNIEKPAKKTNTASNNKKTITDKVENELKKGNELTPTDEFMMDKKSLEIMPNGSGTIKKIDAHNNLSITEVKSTGMNISRSIEEKTVKNARDKEKEKENWEVVKKGSRSHKPK